jgi:hypothetical protein
MNRRILFIAIAACIGAGSSARASVTKVGNGDDGADLEALTPVKSGPIFDARAEALSRLKDLNVIGVAGLGMLLPELEHSDMLMAAQDAHPTGEAAGVLEVSPDRSQVYARTFAEPYAATRFFPASAGLNKDQLVALHIHEALHRSLPAAIRANEDIVMHITMALTSPGASHDRIRQVTGLYVKPVPVAVSDFDNAPAISMRANPVEQGPLPADSKSKFAVQFESYQNSEWSRSNYSGSSQGLEFDTSLGGFKRIGSLAVEPYFRARLKVLTEPGVVSNSFGPSAYDLAARMRSETGALTSIFARFSAKSLDAYQMNTFDRDIWTFGLSHQTQGRRGYLESQAFYSLSSEVGSYNYSTDYGHTSGGIKYKPVLTLAANGGFTFKKWRLGGLAELHASQGQRVTAVTVQFAENGGSYDNSTYEKAPFRLLVLGPEFGYHGESFQFKV